MANLLRRNQLGHEMITANFKIMVKNFDNGRSIKIVFLTKVLQILPEKSEFFHNFVFKFFIGAQAPDVTNSTDFAVQKNVITAWRIVGGVHDEEQQLKTKFGAELTQELCCLVSKLVCVETKKVYFFYKLKNARKLVFHQMLSLTKNWIMVFREHQPIC